MLGEAVTSDPSHWVRVLTAAIVFAVVWPLVARLRRRLSERRRARWDR
jgi:predicted PurR-regulated permease PerM